MKQVESLFSNFTCNPKMLPEFMCYFPRFQKLQTDGQYIVAARSFFRNSIMKIAQCSSTFLSTRNPSCTFAFVMEPHEKKFRNYELLGQKIKYFVITLLHFTK